MPKAKKTKVEKPPAQRCVTCGLVVVKAAYGRWKHVGNRSTAPSCGKPPVVA